MVDPYKSLLSGDTQTIVNRRRGHRVRRFRLQHILRLGMVRKLRRSDMLSDSVTKQLQK